MEAGRRHRIVGSETKDFITHGTARSKSVIVTSVPLSPKFKSDASSWVGGRHAVGLCHSSGALCFRKPPIL